MLILPVAGAVNVWVINVYVAVFKPSVDEYDLPPNTDVKFEVLFGMTAKFVAVPSLTHIFNKSTLPLFPDIGIVFIYKSLLLGELFVSVNIVA